jgi:hypothetical protein
MKTFTYLKQLQKEIKSIYEGMNYKLQKELSIEEDDPLLMKNILESFFVGILRLPRVTANKYFLDCFYTVDSRLSEDRILDYTQHDLKIM